MIVMMTSSRAGRCYGTFLCTFCDLSQIDIEIYISLLSSCFSVSSCYIFGLSCAVGTLASPERPLIYEFSTL